jgi:hypothetical protein
MPASTLATTESPFHCSILTAEEIKSAIRRARRPGAAVDNFITDAALRFDAERPGHEVEVDEDGFCCGDNYDEAGFAYIASKLVAAGKDPDPYEAEICDALAWIRDQSDTATRVAYQGGGGREELEIAAAYSAARDTLADAEPMLSPPREVLPIVARGWRGPRSRASRGSAPVHRRGSRRTSSGSRAGPDDEGELDGESDGPPRRGPLHPARGGLA